MLSSQFCTDGLKIGNGFTISNGLILISKANQNALYNIYKYNAQDKKMHLTSFNSDENDYHPSLSKDNKFLLFNSNRPIPNSKMRSKTVNIWKVEILNNGYSEPRYVEEINTEFHDSYPSLAKNNDLYFNSDRPGGNGSMDIYFSKYENGTWKSPINLKEINSSDSENDLSISKDASFIIFNRYDFKTKEIDLFISKKKNGLWQTVRRLDHINKMGVWELTPSLSEDESFLYLEINGLLKCFPLEN